MRGGNAVEVGHPPTVALGNAASGSDGNARCRRLHPQTDAVNPRWQGPIHLEEGLQTPACYEYCKPRASFHTATGIPSQLVVEGRLSGGLRSEAREAEEMGMGMGMGRKKNRLGHQIMDRNKAEKTRHARAERWDGINQHVTGHTDA